MTSTVSRGWGYGFLEVKINFMNEEIKDFFRLYVFGWMYSDVGICEQYGASFGGVALICAYIDFMGKLYLGITEDRYAKKGFVDFIDESTGGIIDESSLRAVKEKKLDARSCLERHDAHTLLRKINANIYVKGMTGTNVCDVMMFFLTP